MQLPYRKPGKYSSQKIDFHVTQQKLDELKAEFEKLKKESQPQAAKEVQRLAEMGDFSENAAYQVAKGRLRGINDRIHDLEKRISNAIVIVPDGADMVQVGHRVTIDIAGTTHTYQILGSAETDPAHGIVSYSSPLGAALLGHQVGETIRLQQKGTEVTATILKIG